VEQVFRPVRRSLCEYDAIDRNDSKLNVTERNRLTHRKDFIIFTYAIARRAISATSIEAAETSSIGSVNAITKNALTAPLQKSCL